MIANAIQYTQEGTISSLLRSKNGNLTFKLRDTGIGIDQDELFDIFGLLIVSSRTKNLSGGRGVGLSLCKRVLELHNGRVWAKSDGKTGSTFVMMMPVWE